MQFRILPIIISLLAALPAFPQSAGDPDPWSQATLYRDTWGVPHIYADNVAAMAYAFGYAQAEDHLEAMLRAYRVATGRAAAVWGEPWVKSDEFARKMGHADLARQYLQQGDTVTRQLCEGFALGVNTWMVEHPERIPAWAEGVTPEMPLALLHCYLMSFAPMDLPEAWRRDPPARTGNAFALAPGRTQNGHALLGINPHTDYEGPFQWYEAHLMLENLNIYGATLFGVPVILQGHNADLGWALTPNEPDFADVYLERRPQMDTPGNQFNVDRRDTADLLRRYTLANTQTMYVRTEGGHQTHHVICLKTSYGPVLDELQGRFAGYRVGGYADLGAMHQFMAMALASDYDSFQKALMMHQLPLFHVVYADGAGNILYLYNTKVGMKAYSATQANLALSTPGAVAAPEWLQPLDGSDPYRAWGETIPIQWLPAVINPAAGFVQACGNPPWTATDGGDIRASDLPPWLIRDTDTFRAQRMRRLLNFGPWNFEQAQSALFDLLVPAALEVIPRLKTAMEENEALMAGLHPDTKHGIELLGTWNGLAHANSAGMTFFHVWWWSLERLARTEGMGGRTMRELMYSPGEEVDALLLRAASEAAKLLRSGYNQIDVPWGDVHRIRRGDREEPMPGAASGEPIWVSGDWEFRDGTWPVTYGYGYAMAVEFSDPVRSVSVVPFGASENPESPHFDDQLDLFLAQQFKHTRFEFDDVQRHAQSAYGRTLWLGAPGVNGRVALRSPQPVHARLDTLAELPVPLPEGLTFFTLCVAPRLGDSQRLPEGAVLDFELRVPAVLCRPENLGALAVYSYTPLQGWQMLQAQTLDAAAHSFIARDRQLAVYTVAGPQRYRLAPPDTQLLPDRNVEPVLIAKELDEPSVGELGVFEPLPPPAAPSEQNVRDVRNLENQKIIGRDADAIRAAAPDEVPLADVQPDVSPMMPEENASPSSVNPPVMTAEEFRNFIAPGSVADEEPESTTEPAPMRDEPPAQTAEPMEIAAAAPATEKSQSTPPPAPRPAPETASESEGGSGSPRVKSMGPSVWGRQVELRAEGTKASVMATATTAIQARMGVLAAPPAPYPDGLRAFSDLIGVQHFPEVSVEYAIVIPIADDACSEAHLDKLAIYAHDPQQGWSKLPEQKHTAGSRSYSAFDLKPRLYAVLGPPE